MGGPSRACAPRLRGWRNTSLGRACSCSRARRGRSRGCARPRSSWRRGRRCPGTAPIHERLRQKYFMTEAGRPVPHQTARAQREHPGAKVARATGEDQEARVVGDQVQAAELDATVPADPAVTRPALQRRCRKHQKRQFIALDGGRQAHGLAHPRHGAEIVVRLHQVPEAGLVLRRYDVDGHRKNHRLPAPTGLAALNIRARGEEVQYCLQLLARRRERSKHKSALSNGPMNSGRALSQGYSVNSNVIRSTSLGVGR